MRDISSEEQKRIEHEYARSRFLLKSIKDDESLIHLLNSHAKLEVSYNN